MGFRPCLATLLAAAALAAMACSGRAVRPEAGAISHAASAPANRGGNGAESAAPAECLAPAQALADYLLDAKTDIAEAGSLSAELRAAP